MPITIKPNSLHIKNIDGPYQQFSCITGEHVFIRYASSQPTQDSDMKTTPDDWIGIYNGSSAIAPTTHTSYSWYKIKGDSAPSGEVADAVADWLDNHPEATTTVEDGSVTKAKLHSSLSDEIDQKAQAIIESSTSKNTFSATELNALDDYSIESDATGHSSVLISKYEDLCPLTEAFTNSTGTIHKEANINVVTVDGTPISNASYYAKVNAHAYITPKEAISAGDTVYFAISIDGTITGEGTTPGRGILTFKYTDDSMSNELQLDYSLSGGVYTGSLTAAKEVQYIYVTILFRKDYTFDVDATWAVSKVAFSSVTVPASGVVKFGAAEVGDNGFTIIPTPAVAKYKVSIEDYVDAHVPEDMLTKEDLVYLSPEMYGAKGDGVTNDATAIQSCINAAITAGVPVRAYGKYLVGTGIDIVGSYMDVFINYIELASSSSSGYAVRLSGRNNRIVFKQVTAYSTSGACGMRLATTETGDNVQYNNIIISRIDGYTNAIELINNYRDAGKSIYYNTLRVGTIIGRQGNCFYTSGGAMNENSFWGKRATCNSGYFLYNYGWSGSDSNRFYEFCIENNCANGVYGNACLINCRTQECMDLKLPDNDKGNIFKVVDTLPNGCISQNTIIDYISVDVSEAMTLEEAIAATKEYMDNDHTLSKSHAAAKVLLTARGDCVVGECHRLWNYYAVEYPFGWGSTIPHGKVIAYFNHKGFVPNEPWERDVSVSSYTPLVTEPIVPTIFNIKANTSIYFDYSYCCVGINDVKIVQTNGYKATVYDKFGNVIFDGTQQADGTYRLTCVRTDKTITITRDDEQVFTFDLDIRGVYFGDNERWTAEKLNIIS